MCKGIAALKTENLSVKTLQEYHRDDCRSEAEIPP